jgi:cytosine deaminase
LDAESYGFGVGRPARFIVLDAPSWYEALSFNAPVLASYRDGRQLVRRESVSSELLF